MRTSSPILSRSLIALLLAGCYTLEAEPEARPERIEGELVVGLADESAPGDLRDLAERHGLELLELRPLDRAALLGLPAGADEAAVLDALAGEVALDFAEPHYLAHTTRTPDDYGEYLWGLHNTGLNGGTAGADIGAFAAWDRSTGEGVVVAVIDSGVDTTHPDLAPRLWVNADEVPGNGRDDDGNGYVDDVHGWDFVHDDPDPDDRDSHGTHVAGSVAAEGDDGYGVPGVAFGARVMALKFLEGSWGGSMYDAAAAIYYAVDNGAHVINASWGGPGYSTNLRNAIAYARSRGVVFVTAAGNEGADNDRVASYPANFSFDNLLSVAASDRRDRLASFSNYGASSVDIAAPGAAIVSTLPGGDWGWMDGTSMASPYVAGAAALLKSAEPSLAPAQLLDALLTTTDPLQGGGPIATGRLDVAAALDRVLGPVSPGGGEQQEPPVEEEPPAEPEPGAWSFVPFPVESPHPYGNDFSGYVGVDAPAGATELRLHFARLDLEAGYDFATVKDAAGNVLVRWTGDQGAFVSEPIPAASILLWLYTDSSVTGWGLALEGFSWR